MDMEAEARIIEESLSVVKEQAYLMDAAIKTGSLRDVLKHAALLVSELRTSSLSSRIYYDLYSSIINELKPLAEFFDTLGPPKRRLKRLAELYESVQHAGNALPRLYLLVIVAAAISKRQPDVAARLAKDITELAAAVQHPTRGLFFRYYVIHTLKGFLIEGSESNKEAAACAPSVPRLQTASAELGFPTEGDTQLNIKSSCTGDAFPDTQPIVSESFKIEHFEPGSFSALAREESETADDTSSAETKYAVSTSHAADPNTATSAEDAFTFLQLNLYEMARLWVRILYQSHPNLDRSARELDRHSVRPLVSSVIAVMASRRDICAAPFFSTKALPVLLDLIVERLHDSAVQELLLNSVVDHFPAKALAVPASAAAIAKVLVRINPVVDIKSVLANLLRKIAELYFSELKVATANATAAAKAASAAAATAAALAADVTSSSSVGQVQGPNEAHSVKTGYKATEEDLLLLEGSRPDSDRNTTGASQKETLFEEVFSEEAVPTPAHGAADVEKVAAGSHSARLLFETVSPSSEVSAENNDKIVDEAAVCEAAVGEAAVGEAVVGEAAGGEAAAGEASISEIVVSEAAATKTAALCEKAINGSAVGDTVVNRVAASESNAATDSRENAVSFGKTIPEKAGSITADDAAAAATEASRVASLANHVREELLKSALEVFNSIRDALMDLIQKAYEEDFRHSPNAPEVLKALKGKKALPPYALTVPQLLQAITSFELFSLKVFRDRPDLTDLVLYLPETLLKVTPADLDITQDLGPLLSNPLAYPKHLNLLQTNRYNAILSRVHGDSREQVILSMVQAIVAGHCYTSDGVSITRLYDLCGTILQRPEPSDEEKATKPAVGVQWKQNLIDIAALVHTIRNRDDPDVELAILSSVRSSLLLGHPSSYRYTMPPLIWHWLELVPTIHIRQLRTSASDGGTGGVSARRVLQLIHGATADLVSQQLNERGFAAPLAAFRLLLAALEASAGCEFRERGGYRAIAAEFLKQALIVLEEELTDNRSRASSLTLLVTALLRCNKALDRAVYDSAAERVTRAAARLLKASDQCRAILACASLFHSAEVEHCDAAKARECLQRCLKLAHAAVQFRLQQGAGDLPLFVDVLARYVTYLETGIVSAVEVSGLVALCTEHLHFATATVEADASSTAAEAVSSSLKHLHNVVGYIKRRADADPKNVFRGETTATVRAITKEYFLQMCSCLHFEFIGAP